MNNSNDLNQELEVGISIAKAAGVIMKYYFFADDQGVEHKSDKSPVGIADKKINSLVIERLAEAFPDDGVIGEEESNTEYGMGRKWFCDPVDGTVAFLQGVPTAMFSLALVEDGKPLLGIAYDPFLDLMYIGIAGEQSTCNGKPIFVSQKDLSAGGEVAVSSRVNFLGDMPHIQKMITAKVSLVSFNGAVYKTCLVAKGKFSGYIERGVCAHDVAAVHTIIEGAGGKITGIDGNTLDYSKPFRGAIVSNGIVHDQIVEYCK